MESGFASFRVQGALLLPVGPWIKNLADPVASTLYAHNFNPNKTPTFKNLNDFAKMNPTFRNQNDFYKVIQGD